MSLAELAERVERTRAYAYVTGTSELWAAPYLLYLSPTNLCNLRCAVCAREARMRPARGFMTLDTLRALLVKLPDGIRKVYLQKQGEPLLHRDIVEIARLVKARWPDAEVAMHTNGVLMSPERARELAPLLDFIAFSISAITPETYAACHGRPVFARALAGLEAFLAARHEADAYGTNVVIDYVKQEANSHETPEAVRAFFAERAPGLNSVDFHWTDSFQDSIDESALNMAALLPPGVFPRCVWPFASLCVLHDGAVDYCFVEPGEDAPGPNLLAHSFPEVWNGPYFKALREAHIGGDLSAIAAQGMKCRDCAWLWSAPSMRLESLGRGLPDELMPSSGVPEGAEDLTRLGLAAFAAGDFTRALGFLLWARRQNADDRLGALTTRWIELCERALDLSWPRKEWVDALAERGRRPDDLRTRYERFGYGEKLRRQTKARRG